MSPTGKVPKGTTMFGASETADTASSSTLKIPPGPLSSLEKKGNSDDVSNANTKKVSSTQLTHEKRFCLARVLPSTQYGTCI